MRVGPPVGGWLDQTRSCGKVPLHSFLPTRPWARSPGLLRLATGGVAPKETHSSHWALWRLLPADVCVAAGCVWLCGRGCSLRCLGVCNLDSGGARAPGRAASRRCSSRTPWLHWPCGPPGSRTEPVSLPLAGRFLTTREPHTGALYKRYTPELVYQRIHFLLRLGSLTLTVFLEKLHGCPLTRRGREGADGGSRKSLGSNCSKQGPTSTHLFSYLSTFCV